MRPADRRTTLLLSFRDHTSRRTSVARDVRVVSLGMAAKYLLTTLGCKVNQYESQQIRELVESFGLRPAGAGQQADLAVVNTCAVTTAASRKNRQAIRRLARDGRTPVVVVGCGATADRARLSKLAGVVAVLGHDVDVQRELRALLSKRLDHPSEGSTKRKQSVAGELLTDVFLETRRSLELENQGGARAKVKEVRSSREVTRRRTVAPASCRISDGTCWDRWATGDTSINAPISTRRAS